MKKSILSAVLFVILSVAAFAAGKDEALLKSLTEALKHSKQVSWSSNTTHNRAAFGFNGQTVVAYYDKENENLVGYSIYLTPSDLPQDSKAALAKKYPDWQITEAIMFIDSDGYANHFVRAKKGKKDIALKVNGTKISFYSQMF